MLWFLLTAVCMLCCAWGVMALLAQAPAQHNIAQALALVWGFAWLLAWGAGLLQRRMLPVLMGGTVLMLAMLVWWSTILPRSGLDWAPDVEHLVVVETDAAQPAVVQLRNVRNFDWRSETDFTPRWETRSYDLNQLDSVDVALSYWMGPAIAHTLVSFGFKDGQHVVFSIEIRKESHESFDALAGFFKQYEMALVAADERDILGVRTNVRGEEIQMFRIHMPQAAMRELFMAYARQASLLEYAPRFYNTLTANCTTIVWQLARHIGQELPLDWRLLVSGYLPEYLRDVGALDSMQPLELQRKSGDITTRAQQWQPPADASDTQASIDFSRYIRQGM
ncbi:Lnb N-terminal periplasmic domain-containing protein [Comamonas kerstersii]|uniref:Lnb N-terminal periplasmic domain-containing protein n=1 Tax=Comamonas kerstersii TaxID=225992 RepID=UPI0026DB93E7|nr:DUF4105 domain-containing protein [Comamonas kerstersii]